MVSAFRPSGEATRTWAWAGALAPTSIANAVTQAIPDAETASLSGLFLAVYILRQEQAAQSRGFGVGNRLCHCVCDTRRGQCPCPGPGPRRLARWSERAHHRDPRGETLLQPAARRPGGAPAVAAWLRVRGGGTTPARRAAIGRHHQAHRRRDLDPTLGRSGPRAGSPQ